jgi:hypothetical protein
VVGTNRADPGPSQKKPERKNNDPDSARERERGDWRAVTGKTQCLPTSAIGLPLVLVVRGVCDCGFQEFASEPSAPEASELPELWSVQRKAELVLRLLRGEPLDAVSRES